MRSGALAFWYLLVFESQSFDVMLHWFGVSGTSFFNSFEIHIGSIEVSKCCCIRSFKSISYILLATVVFQLRPEHVWRAPSYRHPL